jgi:hypothetical protein
MTTQEEYEYAFIDTNGTVLNVCIFSDTNQELLETIKNSLSAHDFISCNDFGMAIVGGKWDGEHFLYEDGTRVPLTPMPSDLENFYKYNFETNQWVIFGPKPNELNNLS